MDDRRDPRFRAHRNLLAAQAFKYDIATTVRARAIVEPWSKSIMIVVFFFIPGLSEGGLALAFLTSIYAALLVALWSFMRTYGLPKAWKPRPDYLIKMSSRAMPLVGADVIERGTRLIDVFLLGQTASPAAVGIYFFAKEVATLPQKLKTAFEPILGPVITRNLKSGDLPAIAAQVRQVGFWIITLQLGVALALAIPGEAIMGLAGPAIVGGTGALVLLLAAEVIASPAVVSEACSSTWRRSAISRSVSGSLRCKRRSPSCSSCLPTNTASTKGSRRRERRLPCSSRLACRASSRRCCSPACSRRGSLTGTGASPGRPDRQLWSGFLFTLLPEWVELAIGFWAILATYLFVIWEAGIRRGGPRAVQPQDFQSPARHPATDRATFHRPTGHSVRIHGFRQTLW